MTCSASRAPPSRARCACCAAARKWKRLAGGGGGGPGAGLTAGLVSAVVALRGARRVQLRSLGRAAGAACRLLPRCRGVCGTLRAALQAAPDASRRRVACLAPQIRQAYRSRLTKDHPDKGGDPVKFVALQKAYDVLVDDNKRRMYDATGQVERSAEEDLLDAFGGGAARSAQPALLRACGGRAQGAVTGTRRDSLVWHNAAAARPGSRAGTFKENMRAAEAERANQNESITLAETKDMQSHTYLFEAWTRARGEGKARFARCVTAGTSRPAAHMLLIRRFTTARL
jgi:hypothetical protein